MATTKNYKTIEPTAFAEIQLVGEDEPTKPERLSQPAKAAYESLLRWAESEHGRKFINRIGQYAALKKAKGAKLTSVQLKERWEEMEEDKFWSARGFDWHNVVESFNRKP